MDKKASPVVYMMEELGDARMRTDQLKRHIADAVTLFNSLPTDQKEAVTEIAGHLVRSIPETLFLVNKALEATALAANRIDYEEIRKDLQPSKVEELERVLDEVRHVQPRLSSKKEVTSVNIKESKIHPSATNPRLRPSLQHVKTAEIALRSARATGLMANGVSDALLNIGEALRLLAPGVMSPTVSKLAKCAGEVKGFPWEEVEMPPAQFDTKLASEDHDHDYGDDDEDEEGQAKTAGMTLGHAGDFLLSANRDLRKADGIVKDYVITTRDSTFVTCHDDLLTAGVLVGKSLDKVIAKISESGRRSASEGDAAKRSRFEEGVPADPTENMSPEDAAEWENNTEENKDNFKAAAADTARYESVLDSIEKSCKDIRHHLKKGEKTPWEDVSTLFNQIRSTSATMLRKLDKNASGDPSRALAQSKRTLALDVIGPLKGLSKLVDAGVFVMVRGEPEQNFKIPSMVNEALSSAQEVMSKLIDLDSELDTKTAALQNRPMGQGVSAEDLTQEMTKLANNMFKARGDFRDVETAVSDAITGYPAAFGPLAKASDAIFTRTKKLRDDMQEWDRITGAVANGLEVVVRDCKKEGLMNKTASRIVPLETAQKGDMVELELGVPWPRDAKKEKVTGKVMLVKKDGTIVINVEKSRQNPGGHPNEDVGYVERARPAAKTAAGEPTLSRFEEGQDADPTENMSEEDAKKWRLNTLIHKDKFTENDKDSKKACLLKLNLK